jgi:hypothetical protein
LNNLGRGRNAQDKGADGRMVGQISLNGATLCHVEGMSCMHMHAHVLLKKM